MSAPGMTMARPGAPVTAPLAAPVRRRTPWGAVLLSALLAAVLSSVGTVAAIDLWRPTSTANAPGITAPVTPPPAGGDLSGLPQSSATTPYWQGVHAAVENSVVAIQAATSGGGSMGSGFILDDDGHIVTNNHVIAGAIGDQVQVTLADGRLFHADVVGGDAFTDLAVVKLVNPPSDLRPVALGDSDEVYVGDPVLAVGNPLGLANTATTGIVSALNRPVTASGQDGLPETVTNAIQIDAAINPGNSGGPLFDHQGRVIGVTSSIATLTSGLFGQAGSIGLGFAIPVNLAKSISDQLITTGQAEHARLGVRLTSATVTADGVSRRGARVETVYEGTAASMAGLRPGDIVISFNGLPVGGSDSLTAFVRERTVGDAVTMEVVRDGQVLTLNTHLGMLDGDIPVAVPEPDLTVPPEYDEGGETENSDVEVP